LTPIRLVAVFEIAAGFDEASACPTKGATSSRNDIAIIVMDFLNVNVSFICSPKGLIYLKY